MTRILHLRPARDAAGCRHDELPGSTIEEVLEAGVARYGQAFADVLATSQVWLNSDASPRNTPVGPYDEVVVVPPVSGG